MKKQLLCILLLCLGSWTYAQNGNVKGFVYDENNGEPLPFVTIGVEGKTLGAKSDNVGFFTITKIPIGKQVLVFSMIGYETVKKEVEIRENYTISTKVYIPRSKKVLDETKIIAKRTEKKFDTRVGTVKITPKELKILPSVGGEADIAQFLSVMPGVVSTGDQGGQLYIRGGSPIQNKILLDGMTIYNPFHSIGLYSVFETDAIRSADVMSGGFGVEYGDRTSAIMTVTTKDGNKNRMSGKIGINPILAKVFLEGPLSNPKKSKESATTYLLSLKHSYLDKTSTALYGGLGEPYKTQLPFSFTDLYGKVSVNFNSGGKFSFFGFNFNDRVNFKNVSDLKWKNIGVGANFMITPEGSTSLINGGFYYSNYDINLTEADNRPRTSTIGGFDANISVTNYFNNYDEIKYGVEFAGFKTLYNYYNFLGIPFNQDQYTTQIGGYIKTKKNFDNKFIFEPGLRLQYYASIAQGRLEPRVAMKYNFSNQVRLKAAAGMYSQNLISSKSDRDIVNFFQGFLTAPDNKIANFQGKQVKNNLQKATHFVIGIEVDKGDFEFLLEPWYKYFGQLISINRYKLFSNESDFLIETGNAYGTDFTVKYSKDRIYFWGVYSFGYVDRYDGRQTYPTPFDRRHNVNILASYTLGKMKDWTASLRFNYGSPFPFTQTQAFYEQLDFSNGLGTDVLTQNGTLGVLYSDKINGGRLSPYHRMDISLTKKWILKNKSVLEGNVSITNAYNQQNIFYIDRIRNTRTYQLPIFPSIGLNWNF